jgi:hypothetical protein
MSRACEGAHEETRALSQSEANDCEMPAPGVSLNLRQD